METGKKTALNQKSWFLIYLWRMSTSHLYAQLFIATCTMDWMLKAPEPWRLVSKRWDGLDAFPGVGLSTWPAAPPAASLDLLCCVAATLHWRPAIIPALTEVYGCWEARVVEQRLLPVALNWSPLSKLVWTLDVSGVGSGRLSFALWRMHYSHDRSESASSTICLDLEI